MPRSLTLPAIRQTQKENGEIPFLVLLTIEVGGGDSPIRIVNNTEDISSRGNLFLGCPFSLSLPDVGDVSMTDASITVDNVDPRIWQGVRLLDGAPRLTLEVIMASDPDVPLMSTDGLRMREANATTETITGRLMPDTVWQTGFPAHDFDPSQNPGMFTT